uniref:Uncharacterized protein n=1 Tax=Paramormyrops kingsleyae TaxID=1676925 RepID=A0A3B3TC19_9TELE
MSYFCFSLCVYLCPFVEIGLLNVKKGSTYGNIIGIYMVKPLHNICLLQETHLTESETQKFKTSQFSQIYSSTYTSKKLSVSVLINKRITFTHNTTITDPKGCHS